MYIIIERGDYMRIAGKYIIRTISDEIVALPTGSDALHFSGIIGMNPVGRFLFELLSKEQTKETLMEAMVAEYEVDEKTASADIEDFLNILRENHLLSE